MKKLFSIVILALCLSGVSAQAYLRGEVRDEKNNALVNARIVLHSTGYMYYSGNTGAFGIIIPKSSDSITISLDGYQPLSLKVEGSKYQALTMKPLYVAASLHKNRLISFTTNLQLKDRENWASFGESYSTLLENEFVEAKKFPETGFAIRIDKASYSNVRRFLNMDTKVPADAVRVEELLNYFNFGYTPPPPDSIFAFKSYLSDCPWNVSSQLLFLQVCAKKIEPEKIPASNLVFLIDVSGSMDMPNRLPLLKSAFKLLVDNLREKDTISIVVYGSSTGVWLTPTSGKEKMKIRKAIEDLNPGGATPGQSGILSAYRLAKSQFIKDGNNRVILATDGDFNIGQNSEDELEKMITRHQESGIYLTCLGVGMGNYKDSKLEVLAKKGKGNFSYLDNESEAEKVLVKELTQTLYTVADDASLSIRFNKNYVRKYRLIGYDNKLKSLADSLVEVEGGEVGSGYSLMALFEIEPEDKSMNAGQGIGDIATTDIQYHLPADTVRRTSSFKAAYNYVEYHELPACFRFAGSVAIFASLLKESAYTRHVSWMDAIVMANESYDRLDPIQKEFVSILEKARKIYGKPRKKNR